MATFDGLSRSPKVTTVLQRRALAMNPRYILVVSYQTSSNMVALATAPLLWRGWLLFLLVPLAFVLLVTPRLLVLFGCFFGLVVTFPTHCLLLLQPRPFP